MKKILDGCTAATHVAYAMSDIATIYPITPVASMGETAQKWAIAGRLNYRGTTLEVKEMESELGAAGATHGALTAGSLATTFTNSQGLMLMLPNMFKLAGNHLPAVFHVGARTLATHALSIFGDHSDVMATRASGFTYLASCNVQETMDLAVVAHLAAIEGSLPVCHFFDGWRTSGEMASIEVIDYPTIFSLMDAGKVSSFRAHALNPDHPSLAGSAQNPDVFFQNAEASNTAYTAFPAIVQNCMNKLAVAVGRQYHLFDYVGPDDVEVVLVAICSACDVIEQTIAELNRRGYKAGVVKVRLFRPFSAEALMSAIPMSTKTIVALDRTKEPGAEGEPLFKDIATAVVTTGRTSVRVLGCRYGLSSKDFSPAMAKGVIDEALKQHPRRFFTVGITDDVTHLSVEVDPTFRLPSPKGECNAIFYGMGSDGTVGATKQAARILGDTGGMYAQAFFSYSAKKSGGYTTSQLRVSPNPITAEYSIEAADYIGCNKDTYVSRFNMLDKLRDGGIFVLNCSWTDQELPQHIPQAMLRQLARKGVQFYTVDAQAVARKTGLGVRVNMIMETIFFKLTEAIPFETALTELKKQLTEAYMHEGGDIVARNLQAVDMAVSALHKVDVNSQWGGLPLPPTNEVIAAGIPKNTIDFFHTVSKPCLKLEGDRLPVSVFTPDGRMPMGTTVYEKRRIALDVPQWNPQKCIQCTLCSFVCAHAAIRPWLLTPAETKNAPDNLLTTPAHIARTIPEAKDWVYRIQVYTEDCTGCGSCAVVCPGKALTMVPIAEELEPQAQLLDYLQKNVSLKENVLPRFTINGSQFRQPLLEFSGACAGCGETPYVKLLTQLFGERMLVANATGCSSVWGANYPSNAYCTRQADGRGPAWGNSLFEDNAEYGYGMAVACRHRREALLADARELMVKVQPGTSTAQALGEWISAFADPDLSYSTGQTLQTELQNYSPAPNSRAEELCHRILDNADMLGKKSVWAIGGDGWAYDIGFAGLDHVLASGEDINLLVMDTECYSNTGGQTSKATPIGAVTKFSPAGKRTFKKDLGRMMMTYGTVYVASVAIGANYQQVITAMREAEAYPGPSIIIAYCPCINHGIRAGMSHSIVEEHLAVQAGYWPLYRYNPMLQASRLSPYIADRIASRPEEGATPSESNTLKVEYAPTSGNAFAADTLNNYLDGEDRYADIKIAAPKEAPTLRAAMSQHTNLLHTLLDGLSGLDSF